MKYIYLDQKIWIDLAKDVIHGTSDPQRKKLIDKIKAKVDNGEWAFPLSLVHQIETSKRLDDRTRQELAQVMGDFSKNYTVATYLEYKSDEFMILLLSLHGIIKEKLILRDKVIKQDFVNMVGLSFDDLEIINEHLSDSENEKIKAEFLQYVKTTPLFSLYTDYFSSNEFADNMRKDADIFAETYEVARRQLHAAVPDKHKEYRYRIFLVQRFMEVFNEEMQALHKGLVNSGLDAIERFSEKVSNSYESTMNFLCGAPSFHVSETLTFEILNSVDRKFSGNDYYDISFLSTAIPYCDIVITERSWASIAKKYKLDTTYNTKVLYRLDELLNE